MTQPSLFDAPEPEKEEKPKDWDVWPRCIHGREIVFQPPFCALCAVEEGD